MGLTIAGAFLIFGIFITALLLDKLLARIYERRNE